MTEMLLAVIVNLGSTGLAFMLGLSFRRISLGFRTRALRSFWKPITNDGVRVAIGSFFVNDYYRDDPAGHEGIVSLVELAGYAGLGDLDAYIQLKEQLRRAGVRKVELGPGHQVSDEQRRENLILLGGPHSNPLSAMVLRQLPNTFSFGAADGPGDFGKDAKIYDNILDSSMDCKKGPSGELETDQGIMIRCANPFAAKKSVLIIAGSWGFGTAAGTRLIEDRIFLKNAVVNSGVAFEAVFTCKITDGSISNIELGKVRRLAQSPVAARL
ncbi:hypothetical protein [Glycomyces sp. NPDC048151]|uniref:hypothetical protein n=1 Tax=Glycomyces sp. NPDC048151 TaxID=3364002 RepID=UPI00371C4B4B